MLIELFKPIEVTSDPYISNCVPIFISSQRETLKYLQLVCQALDFQPFLFYNVTNSVKECQKVWHENAGQLQRSVIKRGIEQMFFGQYEHNIDAKGRLTIPASFREQAPEGIYLTEGFDSNLIAYPKQHFEQIANNLSELSITDPETRALRRLIFSNAAMLTYDTAGRILIPAFLRATGQINDTCMIIGVGDSFEIWSVELWSLEAQSHNDPQKNSNRWAAINISARGN